MKVYKLENGYKDFIKKIFEAGIRVVAPVNENGTLLFKHVSDLDEIVLPEEYVTTTRSAKEFVFPVTEPVIKYSFSGKEISLEDIALNPQKTVIIGLRPCDAASFNVLDDIFNYKFKDEFYFKRRSSITLISVACEKIDAACFCTSFGISPNSSAGSDILLKKDTFGNFFAYSSTDKGEDLINHFKITLTENKEKVEENPIYKENREKLREELNLTSIKSWLDNNFNNEIWDEIADRCLACGTCAYLCPDCHCFDIVDETKYSEGLRRKNWDACQFSLFTLHASGHNPRDYQAKRYRQRVMHKFKFYPERFNKHLCTGCGRCIRACPVNIDIYQVVKELPVVVE